MVTLPSPGSYSLAKGGKRWESIHIGFSIDGISGSAAVGFSVTEGQVDRLAACRDASTDIFYHFSFSARKAAASPSQLSRGDGRVTPWPSRQFITGPRETNNHLHSHQGAPSPAHMHVFFWFFVVVFLFLFCSVFSFFVLFCFFLGGGAEEPTHTISDTFLFCLFLYLEVQREALVTFTPS